MYIKIYYDLLGGYIIVLKADIAGEWYICDNPERENPQKETQWEKDKVIFTPKIVREKYEGKYIYCKMPDGEDSECFYLTENFCKLLGENNFHETEYKKEMPEGGKAL